MANVPITSITAAGATFTVAGIGQAAAAGDTLNSVDDRTEIVVYNGSGGSINVQLSDPGRTPAGSSAASGLTVAVAVGAATFGVIPVSPAHVDPTTGLATITYSATASVRVAAYRR
jgi:hypothetical protein